MRGRDGEFHFHLFPLTRKSQAISDLSPHAREARNRIGGRDKKERGLTLVELLVVIVILALASSVVLLNAPPSRPAVREDAERFAARLSLAFDEAVATGAQMRVSIDQTGYAFETLDDDAWKPIENDRALSRNVFSSIATVELADAANDNAEALGGEAADEEDAGDDEARHIPLDPLGAQSAFSVRFSSADGAWIVTVTDGAAVEVKLDV